MKTIAYITDIHLNEGLLEELGVNSQKQWLHVLNDLKQRKITELIFGGDIGAASAHEWFFASVKNFRLRFVLGNHDRFDEAGKYHIDYNSGTDALFYTCTEEGFKLIFLDTSTETVNDDQLRWLKKELITDQRIILFIHHPVLAIDTPIDAKYPLHRREKVAEALNEINCPVDVFCGHYHMADVAVKENITQYITPASSYQIVKNAAAIEKDNSTFGYRLITLDMGRLATELIISQSN